MPKQLAPLAQVFQETVALIFKRPSNEEDKAGPRGRQEEAEHASSPPFPSGTRLTQSFLLGSSWGKKKPTPHSRMTAGQPAPSQHHHSHPLSSKRHKGREAESRPTAGLPMFSAPGKGGLWDTSLVSLHNSSLPAKVAPLSALSPHLHSSEDTYCFSVIPTY